MPSTEHRQNYHAMMRSEVFPFVPKRGGALLDVGGGIGATAARLKRMGYVDKAGVADLIADRGEDLDLDFRYGGNVEDPDFLANVILREGPFNVILCLDILEHLRDPWSTVFQLHHALSENGVIIASIPNVRNYTASFPLMFGNRWTLADTGILDRTHLRFFVKSTAIELMTSSGLLLEKVRAIPSAGRKIKLIRALTLGLFNSFTDRQYLVRVKNSQFGNGVAGLDFSAA